MGPNGSGKSTFFRICALIEEPDSGEVEFLSEGDVRLKNDIYLGAGSHSCCRKSGY